MLLELLLLLSVAFFTYHRWQRGYWRRKGVFSLDGGFILGNTGKAFFTKIDHLNQFISDVYQKHKCEKLIGFFNFYTPMLVVTDPEYIKQIFISDYNSFSIAGFHVSSADKLIKYNPFIHQGEEWKGIRGFQLQMVSQGRLKENVSTITRTCQSMVKYLTENKSMPIKVSDVTRYYTIDNVTSVMYGLEPSAFVNPENGFRKHAVDILSENMGLTWICASLMPIISDILRLRFFSKSAEDFFIDIAHKTFEFRKKNKVSRNDLFDHLIKAEQKRISEGKGGISDDEVASYMMTLYADSVDTSSNALSYLLLELANRPEVQDKLRQAVLEVGKDVESFDYEKATSIDYLNQVLNEILRIHPILGIFKRTCTKDTRLGGAEIQKGTTLFIPYSCLINDPEYFPDPEEFNPERFLPENAAQLRGRFFPFGEGPKQCLGMKYAGLQIKMAVISIILNFKLTALTKSGGKKVADIQDENVVFLRPDDKEHIIFESL